jgi:Protein of unknown function (DUF3575)
VLICALFNQIAFFMVMKKMQSIKFLNIAVALFVSQLVMAQNIDKKNTLKLNVIGIFFGDGNIGYEKSLNNKNSIQFNTAFGFQTSDGVRYQMNALAFGYRYYFRGTTEKGWYVNPELGVVNVRVKEGDLNFTNTSYLWRINGGYKITYKSGFTLEFGAGIDGFGNNFEN